jgi:hypothetical protein
MSLVLQEDEAEELRLAVDHAASRLPTEKISYAKLGKGWQAFQDGLICFDGTRKGEPFKPFEYQDKAFDSFFTHPKTALQWSRQTGKTVTTGAYVTYLAKQVRGITALVASFRHEQSILLLDAVYGWSRLHADPAYQLNLPHRRATTHIYFKNGSRLFAVPHGEASLGRTLDLLIFDESQEIPDEDLRASSPTQAASGGRRIWIGTNFAPEGFWYEITQAPKKHGFNLIRVPYQDALLPNGPLIAEAVEADRLLLSPAQFKMNYKLIAIAGVNRFFEKESVDECKVAGPLDPLPEDSVWLAGWDHAISHDESVLTAGVLVDGVWHQCLILSFPRGMPLNRQAERVSEVLPENCPLFVDSTGEAGVQALSECARLGVNARPFDYGKADAKAHLMSQLWQHIQQKKVRIYDQATLDQLIAFRFHLSSSGHEIFGDSSHADDRLNALALAIEGVRSQVGLATRPYMRLIEDRPHEDSYSRVTYPAGHVW